MINIYNNINLNAVKHIRQKQCALLQAEGSHVRVSRVSNVPHLSALNWKDEKSPESTALPSPLLHASQRKIIHVTINKKIGFLKKRLIFSPFNWFCFHFLFYFFSLNEVPEAVE